MRARLLPLLAAAMLLVAGQARPSVAIAQERLTEDADQDHNDGGPEVPAVKADKVMKDTDADGDGQISHAELRARLLLMHKRKYAPGGGKTEAQLSKELERRMKHAGENGAENPDKNDYKTMDVDGDGAITLAESLEELRSSHDTDATAEETEGNEETVQAERKEVELEFKWADKDANGRLSFDEYLHGKVYTRPFDLVDDMDLDGDGRLALEEVLENRSPPLTEDEEKSMSAEEKSANMEEKATEKKWFEASDTDSDGWVSRGEFTLEADIDHKMTAQNYMQSLDTDQNGHLSLDEIGGSPGASANEVASQSIAWDTHPDELQHDHDEL